MSKYITLKERMTVTVPEGEVDGLRVERFEIKPNDLNNLRQEIKYGRGTRPGWYTRLRDHDDIDSDGRPLLWMSDTDAEKDDHAIAVRAIELDKAEKVLINGLGLGMVVAAALSFKHVRRVQVVEKDERVVKLIGPHYTRDPRVEIVHADAYEQTGVWKRGARWNVVWSDIWPEISSANIEGMDRLHKFYRSRSHYHGMWAHRECLKLRRMERAAGLV